MLVDFIAQREIDGEMKTVCETLSKVNYKHKSMDLVYYIDLKKYYASSMDASLEFEITIEEDNSLSLK
jgi:hypothetical protein